MWIVRGRRGPVNPLEPEMPHRDYRSLGSLEPGSKVTGAAQIISGQLSAASKATRKSKQRPNHINPPILIDGISAEQKLQTKID